MLPTPNANEAVLHFTCYFLSDIRTQSVFSSYGPLVTEGGRALQRTSSNGEIPRHPPPPVSDLVEALVSDQERSQAAIKANGVVERNPVRLGVDMRLHVSAEACLIEENILVVVDTVAVEFEFPGIIRRNTSAIEVTSAKIDSVVHSDPYSFCHVRLP